MLKKKKQEKVPCGGSCDIFHGEEDQLGVQALEKKVEYFSDYRQEKAI